MFKPIFPQQAVATVILVENSEAMSHIWSDLQDQYLNKLIDSLVVPNPFAPVGVVLWVQFQVPLTYLSIQPTVLVLESCACQDHGSNSSLPQQYSGYHDGLRDIKFNYTPDNRISVGIVNDCIQVRIFLMYYTLMVFYQIISHKLLDSERFQGLALHLIVVAATTPSDEIDGNYSPNFSPWLHLAQKLAKVNLFQ
jgi:hypothetical protein